eukprot:g2374.t1
MDSPRSPLYTSDFEEEEDKEEEEEEEQQEKDGVNRRNEELEATTDGDWHGREKVHAPCEAENIEVQDPNLPSPPPILKRVALQGAFSSEPRAASSSRLKQQRKQRKRARKSSVFRKLDCVPSPSLDVIVSKANSKTSKLLGPSNIGKRIIFSPSGLQRYKRELDARARALHAVEVSVVERERRVARREEALARKMKSPGFSIPEDDSDGGIASKTMPKESPTTTSKTSRSDGHGKSGTPSWSPMRRKMKNRSVKKGPKERGVTTYSKPGLRRRRQPVHDGQRKSRQPLLLQQQQQQQQQHRDKKPAKKRRDRSKGKVSFDRSWLDNFDSEFDAALSSFQSEFS